MSQLLKKYALLTACAVLALCFATRPAQAQTVNMGGTGDHLLFAYWSADMYTNTNVNIHSPLGVRGGTETKNVVHVRVRKTDADSAANTVVSFDICLMPGDSWTANLSMDGLTVVDAGGCDGDVQASGTGDRGSHTIAAPMAGMDNMVSLGGAESGFLEAWLKPDGTLKDGMGTTVTANDNAADDATPRSISGSAMLVSAMSGFSSSYNATALVGCGNATGGIVTGDTNIADFTTTGGTLNADDGNGCWEIDTDTGGAPIRSALGGAGATPADADAQAQGTTDILTGRWIAIDNDEIMSHTKVVLTFPMNHLNYEARTDGLNESVPAGTDPVSIIAFDDKGAIALDNRKVMLGMAVNMCKFMPAGMDMDDMDDMDMDGDMMMPMLSCNGMDVGELGGMAGGFRIFNNQANDPDGTTLALSTGVETTGLAETDNTGGQDPAETLGAIGLVFSYFMGTDGMQYDQVTSVQSIDVADAAGNL